MKEKKVVDIVIKKGFQPVEGKVNTMYKKDDIVLSIWKVEHDSIELEFSSPRKFSVSIENVVKSITKYMCIECLYNDEDGFYIAGIVYNRRIYENVEQIINHILKFKEGG